jgi:type I restriction enzyme S subunit
VGIDADIAAQFPSGFEESELGLIPKGWAISPISSLATVKGGKQLDRKYFDTDAENPIFGGAGEMGRTVLANADGLVLTVGRVGAYCGQFFWHLGPAWVNNNASHIIPLRESSGYWLYWSLRNSNVDKIKKGAAQPFVSNSDIASISVVCPPRVIESAFHQVAAALHESMMSNLAKGTQLVRFRDTLLPRLISGKLRPPEAEALIEDAVA